MNNNINPVLYAFYLGLKDQLGAKMVHRRHRKSTTCIEIVFHNELIKSVIGRLNTLKEAEQCGYWIMCRLQTKRAHKSYHNRTVFQLFLTPVHPRKRNEARHLAAQTAVDVSFEPIENTVYITKHRHQLNKNCKYICTIQKKAVNLQRICEHGHDKT